MELVKIYTREDERFLRSVITPEEDRHGPSAPLSPGSYRWFQSANVIPIEHWRRVELQRQPKVA